MASSQGTCEHIADALMCHRRKQSDRLERLKACGTTLRRKPAHLQVRPGGELNDATSSRRALRSRRAAQPRPFRPAGGCAQASHPRPHACRARRGSERHCCAPGAATDRRRAGAADPGWAGNVSLLVEVGTPAPGSALQAESSPVLIRARRPSRAPSRGRAECQQSPAETPIGSRPGSPSAPPGCRAGPALPRERPPRRARGLRPGPVTVHGVQAACERAPQALRRGSRCPSS